jgi:rhodanese-related sulfurtransferase
VLFDADGIRALTVASWLRQMGHDACVLDQGLHSGLALPEAQAAALPRLETVDSATLSRQMAAGEVVVIDLRPSMQFRKGHIPGSRWSIRPVLQHALAQDPRPIVLVADEAAVAACAAVDLAVDGRVPRLLAGGFDAWRQAGLPAEEDGSNPPDADCIDFLFFVHDRHDGNKEAARRYLAWETGLIDQLDARELASFHIG